MTARRLRRTVGMAVAAAALGSLALAGSAPAAPSRSATQGAFVIGAGNATMGAHVTFWGAQWWKDNDLIVDDGAPPSFKGWAHVPDLSCALPWATRPGNSSVPPDAVAPLIPVLVATEIGKDGPLISGDAVNVALVAVDPGYGPAPGHAGTGTVVGFQGCDSGGDTF